MWVLECADGGLQLRFRKQPEAAPASAIVAAAPPPRKEASFLPPNLSAPKKRRSFRRLKNKNSMKKPTPAADSLSSTLTDLEDGEEEKQGWSSSFSSGMVLQSLNLDLESHKEPDWTRLDEEQGYISASPAGMVIETLLHFKPESDNKPDDWSGMILLADVVDSISHGLQRGNTTVENLSSINVPGGVERVNQKAFEWPLCTEQVLKNLILFESTEKNRPQFGWPYLKLPKKSRQQRKKRLQFGVAFAMKIQGKRTTTGNNGLKRGLEGGIREENERISKKPRISNKVKPVLEKLPELVLQKKHFLSSPAKNANPNLLLCAAY